jgi:hypothetical protein
MSAGSGIAAGMRERRTSNAKSGSNVYSPVAQKKGAPLVVISQGAPEVFFRRG